MNGHAVKFTGGYLEDKDKMYRVRNHFLFNSLLSLSFYVQSPLVVKTSWQPESKLKADSTRNLAKHTTT